MIARKSASTWQRCCTEGGGGGIGAMDATMRTGGNRDGILGVPRAPDTAVQLCGTIHGSAGAADEHDVIRNIVLLRGLTYNHRAIGIADEDVLSPRKALPQGALEAA